VALRWDGWKPEDLGIRLKGLFPSVLVGLGLGIGLGVVGNLGYFVRYGFLSSGVLGFGSGELGVFLTSGLGDGFLGGIVVCRVFFAEA
jgi:hypothetical protein